MFVFLVSIAVLVQASSARQFASASAAGYETNTKFRFPSFTSASCSDGSLICTDSVTSCDGFLSLTSPGDLQIGQVGHVLFKHPVPVWSARISTSFTFRIIPSHNSPNSPRNGMSFIMVSDNSSFPASTYEIYLLIVDPSSDGSPSNLIIIESEAHINNSNKDIDGNHVSTETKSVTNSLASKTLNHKGIDFKRGKNITVLIHSHGNGFSVLVDKVNDSKPRTNILNTTMDISKILPSSAYVGFTALTGAFAHQLLEWDFSSSLV